MISYFYCRFFHPSVNFERYNAILVQAFLPVIVVVKREVGELFLGKLLHHRLECYRLLS